MSAISNSVRRSRSFRIDQAGLLVSLILVGVFLALASPFFLLPQNLFNVARAISYSGITAAIATLVLVSGGLDLSIGAVMALVGVVCAQMLGAKVPWPLVVIAGLLTGVIVGAVNGTLVTYVGINPFIVTIGSQFLVRGIAYALVKGQELIITEPNFLYLGQGTLGGVPFPALLMIGMFLLVGWWMRYTRFGKHVYAIGGSLSASRLAGIPVNRRRMQVYILSGAFAALSGIVLAGFTGSGLAYAAAGSELTVIAAVILGGTALMGGRGTVLGTLMGVVLLGIINNGFVLLSVPSYWQYVVQGAALLLAVVLDEVRAKRAAR
ncbi:MAG: ABC transporter permease [Anaerolineae bacterium]|nr:ABC transporter permease [Anaerolineae bacterium]